MKETFWFATFFWGIKKPRRISSSRFLAGPQGFEPWMTESESVALPLGDGPMLSQQMVLYIRYPHVSTTFFNFFIFFKKAMKTAVLAYQLRHKWFRLPILNQPFHWYVQLPPSLFLLFFPLEQVRSFALQPHTHFP